MHMEKVFRDSLERISNRKIDGLSFLEYFYQIFVSDSKEISELFKSTDFSKQSEMLRKSISELVHFYIDRKVTHEIYAIGENHNKYNLDIRPELYDLWLKKLCLAVEKYDELFCPKVELSWHIILSPGIAFMKYCHGHTKIPIE